MIDPSTPVGKLRLAVGDIQDLPILPDIVYTQTLSYNDNNIKRSSQVVAGYIAGVLSQRTKEKLSFIEINGSDVFDNYMKFIKGVMTNPYMSGESPIPYSGGASTKNPLIQFQEDWSAAYSGETDSTRLHNIASTVGGL